MTTTTKPLFTDLDAFVRGYLEAAFFTNDDNAPGGCDYRDTGRVSVMYDKLAPEVLTQAQRECEAFQCANSVALSHAGDDEQNGRDFWFTRCGHGAGFWDRGYEAIGDELTEQSRKAGNRDLYEGDDKQLYFQ